MIEEGTVGSESEDALLPSSIRSSPVFHFTLSCSNVLNSPSPGYFWILIITGGRENSKGQVVRPLPASRTGYTKAMECRWQ